MTTLTPMCKAMRKPCSEVGAVEDRGEAGRYGEIYPRLYNVEKREIILEARQNRVGAIT